MLCAAAAKAAIGGDVGDKLAVDPDLSIVAQRIKKCAAGADGHESLPDSSCHCAEGSDEAISTRRAPSPEIGSSTRS